MDFKYVDIHSHLHFDSYDKDRKAVIEQMLRDQVATISVGIDTEKSKQEVALAEKYPNIFACIGIHPGDSAESFDDNRSVFSELVKSEKVVAIGECGLDFAFLSADPTEKTASKKLQYENFEAQIAFAVEHNLPVMIHTRNAEKETIDFLESKKREYGDRLRGNVHFFTQSIDFARRYFDIDFTISFTGVITFTHDYDEVVRFAPLDKIHAETDAPFVAPVPNRGKRNQPDFVKYVYERIADIRDQDREVVRKQLVANAVRDFNLK